MKQVYIIIHSLHYTPRPSIFLKATRERLAKLRQEEKLGVWPDRWIERVTPSKWHKIKAQEEREALDKQYDELIMKKYNVASDYKQNRWFMEQVRPALMAFLALLLFSCSSPGECIYEKDKKIRGERQRFVKFNSNKCPTYGKYHNWLWIIPVKQK